MTVDNSDSDRSSRLTIEQTVGLEANNQGCQSALKSIHLTASNNVQQLNKVIPFSAPFYAA
jgi:hypothetical protein